MEILAETGISIWLIVKIAILFALLIYIVFAVVMKRQVNLMTDTLELGQEKTIRALSFAHLIFAVFVFFFALVIL